MVHRRLTTPGRPSPSVDSLLAQGLPADGAALDGVGLIGPHDLACALLRRRRQQDAHEGTQSVLWGEDVRKQLKAPELNLAPYIKDGTVTDDDNGE
ncbi:hypothetical protein [Streptomyces acidicola]|uniref:hypothetical protein n=1 Tax=Streptomyces acidicola TaxID=2596892 RepID=UPI00381F2772